MGQKVNPHGLRVGVIKDWDSKWYADKDFADNLVEDHEIRTFLKKRLSIIIGGTTSSGKTELQKYLISKLDANSRLII